MTTHETQNTTLIKSTQIYSTHVNSKRNGLASALFSQAGERKIKLEEQTNPTAPRDQRASPPPAAQWLYNSL